MRCINQKVKASKPKLPSAQLALGLFAGLRTCELFNLRFEDIRFQRKLIILSAHQTKTRTRRVVDNLSENLLAWLAPHVNSRGPICPQETTVEWRLPLLVKAIQTEHPEFAWKRNGMRHSSASYHLAKGRNENITALVHGHRPEMLFRYYRELVCAEEAEMYYGIFPSVSSLPQSPDLPATTVDPLFTRTSKAPA